MKISLGSGPLPHAEHDVAFDALRPLRFRKRQLAGCNTVCPVREQRQCFLPTKPVQSHGHVRLGLTGLKAKRPSLDRRLDGIPRRFPFFWNRADTLGAERMTGLTRVLERIDPIVLILHHRLNAVPVRAGARKLALVRNPQHRIPIHTWIVFGRCGGRRRRYRGQVQVLSWRRLHFGRIDKPIAAHPNVVGCFRKLRNNIAATVIGDHGLGEPGRKVGGFRDDPYARFRPVPAGNHAAQIRAADRDLRGRTLLGV